MPTPIDAPRYRGKTQQQVAKVEAARAKFAEELVKPTTRERPAWMTNRALLPRKPPPLPSKP
jgi:hypothetical protein